MEQYVAIGDIHGCANTLNALLDKLQPEYSNRTFVFIGDYIDRGPNSKGVIDLLISFAATHKCVFLRGNHEQMMIDSYETGDLSNWHINGGLSTAKSYQSKTKKIDLPYQHHHFIHNTRMYYDTESYFFVHAGTLTELTIAEAIADESVHNEFLWTRSHIACKSTPEWEKKVVFGHTVFEAPLVNDFMIGIDTGCVYSNRLPDARLTAVLLPEEKFVFQPNLDKSETL